jgi:hypothetical protein
MGLLSQGFGQQLAFTETLTKRLAATTAARSFVVKWRIIRYQFKWNYVRSFHK